MEHNELMEEMEMVEKMPINERIKLAKKRRKQQLATYNKWAKTDSQDGRKKGIQSVTFSSDVQLMDAAAKGAYDEIDTLLNSGVNPNLKNHDGLTALHQCCIDGSEEMVSLLLMFGADVNVTDRDLWTPLHAAATCGHFKVVVLLVQSGADLTIINGDGDMPCDITEDEVTLQYIENEMLKNGIDQKEREKIRNCAHNTLLVDVSTILNSGGNINQLLDHGETFLHVAIANGFNDIVHLLLEAEADATTADEDGWQPIHVAAFWQNDEALELLGSFPKVNLRATTSTGETPYELCDDSELKFKIISMLSDRSDTQQLTREQSIENDDDDNINDHDNDVQEGQNVDQDSTSFLSDQADSARSSLEDTPVSPLINIELSSDRRNSIKEVKHMVPIRRMNSERSSGRVKRIKTQSDTDGSKIEEVEKTIQKVEKTQVITIPHTLPNMETYKELYEFTPPLNTGSPQAEEMSYFVQPLSVMNMEQTYPTEETISKDSKEEREENQNETTGHSRVQGHMKKELGKDVVVIRRKKNQAPQPPKGSLLDLKMQRQSLREQQQEEIHQGRGEARPASTFYQPLPDQNTRVYEAPSSPSAIRYRFKMVQDDTPVPSLVKEKKCVIM
ncbi:hypothetical protein Pcinc_004903 [Petrolisthes cinctipes]|uniref:Protein phosphatase 1 regulatory subunit 16A n=1 Tax=Petrolisthes cinctipes TaxID=88211 RepID=A0AAE1GFY0_PETCI|nr:hypothetical protein Pcinc_004903 [Petrolisthes cinctipes]